MTYELSYTRQPGKPPPEPPAPGPSSPAELVDEAIIDWHAETPGVISTTYIDSVTGGTWAVAAPASPGDMAVSISAADGLQIAGTAGAADQFLEFSANVNSMMVGLGAPPFDPALDTVEIVHVLSSVDVTPVWSQVQILHLVTIAYHMVAAFRNNSGVMKRRVEQVGPTTDVWETNETLTSAVLLQRIQGASVVTRYNNTAVGEITDYDSLTTFAVKDRWCPEANVVTGNADALVSQTRLRIAGQSTGRTELKVSKTILRRWRSP